MKKIFSALCLFVLMCVMISCGGKDKSTQTTDAKDGKEQITLTVLYDMDMTDTNSASENELVWDKFLAENPDIKLVRENISGEPFHQKTAALVASDNMPDLFWMYPSGRSAILHNNKIPKDLMPFLERDGLVESYNPVVLAPQQCGYLAELPVGLTATHMLYINKKLLEDNGLKVPTTYEEMKALIKPLKKKGIALIAMDNEAGWVMQSCFFSMLVGRYAGGNWANDLAAGKIAFTDEWFVKPLEVLADMYESGMINRNSLQSPYGTSRGEFANGKAAFLIDGDWAVGAFLTDLSSGQALISPERQKTDIILGMMPAFPGEKYPGNNSTIVSTGFGMNSKIPAGSAKEEAAWRFIKYMQGEYVQTYRLTTNGKIPSNIKVDVSKVAKEHNLEPFVEKRAEFYTTFGNTSPVIDGALDPEVAVAINNGLQELGLGSKTPQQVAADIQKVWEDWVARQ